MFCPHRVFDVLVVLQPEGGPVFRTQLFSSDTKWDVVRQQFNAFPATDPVANEVLRLLEQVVFLA